MVQYRKDMEEETVNAIANELHSQTKQTFDKVVETDWRLTQHNLLVNAGGSAAVLAYLGTSASSKFAVWSLLCFLVGVIASGVEIRALLAIYSELHNDALNRLSGFMKNELPVEKAIPSTTITKVPSRVNHWSGWVAQTSFVLGVGVGLFLFLCYTP
jgi:hypothetical protein